VQALREKADDPAFQAEWQQMKQAAKVRALARISEATGVRLPEHAMLDVQVRSPITIFSDALVASSEITHMLSVSCR
jgi:hypothetical protein